MDLNGQATGKEVCAGSGKSATRILIETEMKIFG